MCGSNDCCMMMEVAINMLPWDKNVIYKKKYSFFLKTAKMADFKPFKALSDGWRAKWHIMHAIHKDNK